MKILGFVSLHYGGPYFKESLLSIRDHVEKCYIAVSKSPSHGFRTEAENPDSIHQLRQIAVEVLGDKLIWEEFEHFHTEVEHRAMRYKYAIGYDAILIADPDEIMEGIPEALEYVEKHPQRFYGVTGYRHYWKGHDYYFIDDQRPTRLEKLTVANMDYNYECPLVVHHMSYAQNDEILAYKLQVFGHKNEVRPRWIDLYNMWTPEGGYHWLHPTRTDIWESPIKREFELPALLQNHKKQVKNRKKLLWIPMDYHRHQEGPELFQDILEGLQMLYDAQIFDGNLAQAIIWRPDIILFQASLGINQCQLLKHHTGALFLMYTGDGTYSPPQSFISYKNIVDAYLVPFSGLGLDVYQTLLGKPCFFLWESIQNWRFVPNQHLTEGQVRFVGNYYRHLQGGQFRGDLDQMDIEAYGSGLGGIRQPINYLDTPKLYNESLAVICDNNYYDQPEYFTPRNLGAIAAGSCALMRVFPGIEKHFQNMVHCIYYRDNYELREWIDFLNKNYDVRNEIAANGYKLANDNFKTSNWAIALGQIINKFVK